MIISNHEPLHRPNQHTVILSGFGGQGILFAGQLLCYAGMAAGWEVTWIPSYGPEMRGGTANCTVVISDEPIGSPLIRNPKVAVVMSPEAMLKYEPLVQPEGMLVVNTSLVKDAPSRRDLCVIEVPASDLATELGNVKMANVVMLGALLPQLDCVVKKQAWSNPFMRGVVRSAGYVPNDLGDRVLDAGRALRLHPDSDPLYDAS